MIVESVILQNLNSEQLASLIAESVKGQLEDFKRGFNVFEPDELLTREQTCTFLNIDASTLWHWTKKGKLTAYGIANRRYYKKADLLNALQPLKK